MRDLWFGDTVPKTVFGRKIHPDTVSRVGGTEKANGSEIRLDLDK